MKEKWFNGLIVLLALLVLFSFYVTFWKVEDRVEKQVSKSYVEKDSTVEQVDTDTIQYPIDMLIKKECITRKISSVAQQKNISEFTTSQNTPEEMQVYTEDIYDVLEPAAYEEDLIESDEAFEALDTYVKERSIQMREHENISLKEEYFTEEEQYPDVYEYEMELPYIEQ